MMYLLKSDVEIPYKLKKSISKIVTSCFGSLIVFPIFPFLAHSNKGSPLTVFEEYGTVSRVSLPSDRETGRPRGFGFVEMSSDDEETAAIESLDGAEWMGRQLRVNKARPRPNNNRGADSNRSFESSSRNY